MAEQHTGSHKPETGDDSGIPPASASNEARKTRSRLKITHPVELNQSFTIDADDRNRKSPKRKRPKPRPSP